jgi:hypothetical protein
MNKVLTCTCLLNLLFYRRPALFKKNASGSTTPSIRFKLPLRLTSLYSLTTFTQPAIMKKIFTIIICMAFAKADAQIILNEVYPIPGNGRHEFFELYNNAPGSGSLSMDSYSIVTYFEEQGNKKGFYVLDLPDIMLPSLSYFVGAAASPFNYQGVTNSSSAQFSWNDAAFLAANNGYLRKWLMQSNTPTNIDGNEYYDLAPIPANFNDFFSKVGGGSASYVVFLYKNGVLINCLLGASGGSSQMPSSIISMPPLFVEMSGAVTDYTIDFSSYINQPFESVGQEVGTDNGFIRRRDGFCGSWTKSSSNVNHTPGFSNGGGTEEMAVISIAAVISPGNISIGSTLIYEVAGAPLSTFPITLDVYSDNGTKPGILDAGDTYRATNIAESLETGPFYTNIPFGSHAIIVCRTSAGCVDRILMITNTGILPVSFIQFRKSEFENGYKLFWSVEGNELNRYFEIQSSVDGNNFTTLQKINGTGKTGVENYSGMVNVPADAFYRIRSVDLSNKTAYSSSILISKRSNTQRLLVISEPGESRIRIRLDHTKQENAKIAIYNSSGGKLHESFLMLGKGQQEVSIPIKESLAPGIYIVEIQTPQNRQTGKFLRR